MSGIMSHDIIPDSYAKQCVWERYRRMDFIIEGCAGSGYMDKNHTAVPVIRCMRLFST